MAAAAAHAAGGCGGPLGTLGSTNAPRAGTLGSDSGCRSLGRYGNRGSPSRYAGRHTFRMPAAGWVTIDLVATGWGRDWIDAYLVLMNGNDSLEALEGCQEITTEHWQCDYYSDQLFQAELNLGSLLQSEYVVPALRKGVLHPAGGLAVCGVMYLRATYLPSPQTRAAAIGACGAAVVPPDSNSQIQQ